MNRRRFLRGSAAGFGLMSLPRLRLLAAEPDFVFTRLSYESGDWNVDERAPSNILNALIEYTTLRVDLEVAGRRLLRFTPTERDHFERYVRQGGFVFVDDCNHDIDGLFARSFEAQMAEIFGAEALQCIPGDHALYSSFFDFDGPPRTAQELNGWGDDLVHEYLKAIEINGRIAVLYSNKDYGCEWDFDFRNKRFMVTDTTRFAVNIVVYAMTS
jgi:hypothetical protein